MKSFLKNELKHAKTLKITPIENKIADTDITPISNNLSSLITAIENKEYDIVESLLNSSFKYSLQQEGILKIFQKALKYKEKTLLSLLFNFVIKPDYIYELSLALASNDAEIIKFIIINGIKTTNLKNISFKEASKHLGIEKLLLAYCGNNLKYCEKIFWSF